MSQQKTSYKWDEQKTPDKLNMSLKLGEQMANYWAYFWAIQR